MNRQERLVRKEAPASFYLGSSLPDAFENGGSLPAEFALEGDDQTQFSPCRPRLAHLEMNLGQAPVVLLFRLNRSQAETGFQCPQSLGKVAKQMATYLVTNTIDRLVELSVAQRRFSMLVLAVFAGMATILAMVGIYGVMSYSVTRRTHEIGLRMALGAPTRHVLRMIVGEGIVLAAAGVGLGVAGALGITRVMRKLLYGITSTDPVTYVTVSLLLVSVALLASYFPARRATKIDPLIALRHD